MLARRINVDVLPQLAAIAVGCVALLAAVLLAASGHSKYALYAVIVLAVGPAISYLAIVTEPAITASIAFALTVFAGNWTYMHVPVPLDRLAWIGVLGGLAWRALRDDPRFERLRFRRVHLIMLFALAYAIGSACLAGTVTDSGAIVGLLDKYGIVPFLLFFFAPVIFPSTRERNYLVVALVVLGVYLGLTAWAEGLSVNALVFPKYILNPNVGDHFGRARGPFVEAAANGLGLYICAMGAVIAMRTWESVRARAFAGLIALLCVSGVIFTLTREAWLGAVAASVVIAILTPELRRYLVPGAIVAVVVVAGALVFIPSLSSSASSRLGYQNSLWDRFNSDTAGLRMLEAKPVFGFGWSTYANEVQPYYRLDPNYPLTTVGAIHNEFLSNLVELGVVGTVIWLAALLMGIGSPLIRRGPPGERRIWWTALLGVAICWFTIANFTPQDYSFANAALWLFAGVTGSISPVPEGARAPSARRIPRVRPQPPQPAVTSPA